MQEKYESEIENFSVKEDTYIKNGVIKRRKPTNFTAYIVFMVFLVYLIVSTGLFVTL